MTFDKPTLRGLFDSMRWADELMMTAAGTVGDDAYYAERGFSLGSIHKLLVHGLTAQKLWLSRWRGVQPARIEDATDHPTRELLSARWSAMHEELAAFLDAQTAETLAAEVEGTNSFGEKFSLPLSCLMYHVVDHAMYHRGQINSMIKLAGGTPCNPFFTRHLVSLAR